MVEKLVHNLHASDEDAMLFCGFNDGPYDEAIYLVRHLMRAPGCTKGDAWVCALAPLNARRSTMITEERDLSKLFPGPDDKLQFGRFCYYLINKPGLGTQMEKIVLMTGWKPLDAYPKKRNFFAEYAKRSKPANLFVSFYGDVRVGDPPRRYSKKRLTKTKQRQLSQEDMERAIRSRGGVPKLPVFADECFTAEDGRSIKHLNILMLVNF